MRLVDSVAEHRLVHLAHRKHTAVLWAAMGSVMPDSKAKGAAGDRREILTVILDPSERGVVLASLLDFISRHNLRIPIDAPDTGAAQDTSDPPCSILLGDETELPFTEAPPLSGRAPFGCSSTTAAKAPSSPPKTSPRCLMPQPPLSNIRLRPRTTRPRPRKRTYRVPVPKKTDSSAEYP